MARFDIRSPFDRLWENKDIFAEVFALGGEEFRNVKNRRTFRIEVEGRGFFVSPKESDVIAKSASLLLASALDITFGTRV